jgi:hypothetical protein
LFDLGQPGGSQRMICQGASRVVLDRVDRVAWVVGLIGHDGSELWTLRRPPPNRTGEGITDDPSHP